jgi:hypothetical protein
VRGSDGDPAGLSPWQRLEFKRSAEASVKVVSSGFEPFVLPLVYSASGDPKYSSTRGDEPATTREYRAHDAPKRSVIHPSREGVCALVQSGNMITDQIRSTGYLMTRKGIPEWEVEVR